jgi:hypothetical protein
MPRAYVGGDALSEVFGQVMTRMCRAARAQMYAEPPTECRDSSVSNEPLARHPRPAE